MSASLGWRGLKKAFCTFWLFSASGALVFGASGTGGIVLRGSTNQVGSFQQIEFSIDVPGSYTNPFDPDEVDLKLRLTAPSGKTLDVPAFWHQPYERKPIGDRDWIYPGGEPAWKARFAPEEIGAYTAVAVLKHGNKTMESGTVDFQSFRSHKKGFLRVSATDSRFFQFSTGEAFFPIGQNLAFIGSQQYVTLSRAEQIFGKLAGNGANYLRIWTCCEDWAMAIEARKSAFGRSWEWKPPITPLPGADVSGQKCLKLLPDKNLLKIEPSHPVALRPATRYVFSGKARTDPGTTLLVNWGSQSAEPILADGDDLGWRAFRQEFQTQPEGWWMPGVSLKSTGSGAVWVAGLSLREAGTGPELLWEAELNRPTRGYYNPIDSFMLDDIVASAERHGILLQLCYLTRDLYMSALKDPGKPEYELAIRDAQKALRYAIARWGCSTSVAAWEYWNEMDPGLPTDRFYTEVGEYLEREDPYKHLRTTSTWGPSAKDCRHAKLDIADVHFYLRPADKGRLEDEVDAVLERTRWLRQQAPGKPAHLGEFGLANDKWQPTPEMNRSRDIVDFHNATWASALSGASGTAMFWWWDRLDQRNPYGHYLPLSRFVADIPWTSGAVEVSEAGCSDSRVRVVGLQARDRAWLWLFNRDSSWNRTVVEGKQAGRIEQSVLSIKKLPAGRYEIRWCDTQEGRIIKRNIGGVEDGVLRGEAPEFERDLACAIAPAKQP